MQYCVDCRSFRDRPRAFWARGGRFPGLWSGYCSSFAKTHTGIPSCLSLPSSSCRSTFCLEACLYPARTRITASIASLFAAVYELFGPMVTDFRVFAGFVKPLIVDAVAELSGVEASLVENRAGGFVVAAGASDVGVEWSSSWREVS